MEQRNRKTLDELKRRLKLIQDDIEVAKKTKANLEKSNEELSEKIDEETFQLEELRSKQFEVDDEEEDDKQSEKENTKKTFFGNLADLEAWEASTRAQIEELKSLSLRLTHEYTAETQKRKQLSNKLSTNKERFDLQLEQKVKYQSDLSVADQESIQLQEKVDDLSEAATELEEEYAQRLAEFQTADDTVQRELEEQKKPLIEKRKALIMELDKVEREYQRAQEKAEEERKNAMKEEKRATSVGSWIAARSILLDKMKRKRQQMDRESNSLEKEKATTEELKRKFISMFGNDDPGDGSGPLAKVMVQAEIDSSSKVEVQSASAQQEINVELQYNETLKETLNQLDNSIKVFENYKKSALKSLKEEIDECNQDGFLVLLQAERDDLMVKCSKK